MHTFSYSFFFSSVWICFVTSLFCLVLFFLLLIFQADTSLFWFHLIVEKVILHILLIIMITRTTTWNLPGPSGIRDSIMQTSTFNFDIFLFLDFTAFLLSICFFFDASISLYFFLRFSSICFFFDISIPLYFLSTSFKKLFFLCSIHQTVPLLFLCSLQ